LAITGKATTEQIPLRTTEFDEAEFLESAKKNLEAHRPLRLKEVTILLRVSKSTIYRSSVLKKTTKGLFTADSVISAMKGASK
jgi:hypothetical protein